MESSKPHSQLGAGKLPLGIPDYGKKTHPPLVRFSGLQLWKGQGVRVV